MNSLLELDSSWKVGKITPLVDEWVCHLSKREVNLLDVGGGAGAILKAVSAYIEGTYSIRVNKFALDISSEMLEMQKKRNPDLREALNEDICKTSLGNKEIDLTLVIDVLEHLTSPTEALEEIKRISNFAIFKIPLEDNLLLAIWNFVNRGKPRRHAIETTGHISTYSFGEVNHQIEKHTGRVSDYYFTNVFQYRRNSGHYRKTMKLGSKLVNSVALFTFRLSPKLCSVIFNDCVMILVECRE